MPRSLFKQQNTVGLSLKVTGFIVIGWGIIMDSLFWQS